METPQGKELASKGYACITFGITLAKLRSSEIPEKPQKTSYRKLTAKYATKQQRDLLRHYYGEPVSHVRNLPPNQSDDTVVSCLCFLGEVKV